MGSNPVRRKYLCKVIHSKGEIRFRARVQTYKPEQITAIIPIEIPFEDVYHCEFYEENVNDFDPHVDITLYTEQVYIRRNIYIDTGANRIRRTFNNRYSTSSKAVIETRRKNPITGK